MGCRVRRHGICSMVGEGGRVGGRNGGREGEGGREGCIYLHGQFLDLLYIWGSVSLQWYVREGGKEENN